MKVAVRARHLAVVGVAAGMTVLVTSVRRAQVAGGSMAPALLPGDRLVVVGLPWGLQPWPRVGAVVAVRDPRDSRRVLVKRVSAVDREAGTIFVVGDAPDVSTDSRTFGPSTDTVHRAETAVESGTRGVRSVAMPSHEDKLSLLLTSDYLDGIEDRPLEEIRAMRAECQQSEVALSYVRRLIQGRLDIVHTFLEYPSDDASLDLGTLVNDLPGILSSGPGRPAGFGHLPMLIGPDTEDTELTADLTAELDAVLGAEEIGRLSDLDKAKLNDVATRLGAIEHRVSGIRRSLHERIDALQAELVSRHKSGRASVDGLLS